MPANHTLTDHIFLALIVVFAILEWRWLWPRAVRAVASGAPDARMKIYRSIISSEWLFTACVVGFWLLHGRSWAGLMLVPAFSPRILLGLVFAFLVSGLLWVQNQRISARPDRMLKVRTRLEFAGPLLPHTGREHRMFMLVSFTAGVCEEVLFRGFLMWYFAAWTGPVAAAIISSVVFGFAHLYLGWRQVPRTGLLGVVFAFVVLASGSLWPAIIIHAAVDLSSGDLAYNALRSPVQEEHGSKAAVSA